MRLMDGLKIYSESNGGDEDVETHGWVKILKLMMKHFVQVQRNICWGEREKTRKRHILK